jgi:hypothetical protein
VPTPKSGVGLARSQGRGQAADTSSSHRAGKPSRKASDRAAGVVTVSHRAPLMRRQRPRDQLQPLVPHGW